MENRFLRSPRLCGGKKEKKRHAEIIENMEHLGGSNVIRKIHMLERYVYIYILKWIYCRLKYTRPVIVNHLTRLSLVQTLFIIQLYEKFCIH